MSNDAKPEDKVVEATFPLNWDSLSNLYVPNMENVWVTVKTRKGTGKIVSVVIANRLGDKISLKNGGVS
ncbi:MAG: hypothetical protein WB988_19000 [Candidatus Nitrosopolaris sp.]